MAACGFSAWGPARAADSLYISDEVTTWEDLGSDAAVVRRPELILERAAGFLSKEQKEQKEGMEAKPGGFLEPGPVENAFVTPTGSVAQPRVVVFGEFRTAVQTFDNGVTDVTEWANRLDLFANIYITPTERFLVGFRPLDRNGNFTGYRSGNAVRDGWDEFLDGDPQVFFFEGDLGEMFPGLDPNDSKHFDYNLSVGRMPLEFQDGIMINDSLDAVALTRSSLFGLGASALRIAGVFGFNEIDRGDNREDDDALLYGLFLSADYEKSTYDADFLYVDGSDGRGGDGAYFGLAQTRRFGHLNSTLRANFSWALDGESAAVSTGTLLFSQLSRSVGASHDIVYLDSFWAIDDYSSAARDPAAGGPLGQTGLLFDAVGLGTYGSALGNRANGAAGAAIGYQHFLDDRNRKQIVTEVGGRAATRNEGRSAGALGARYQEAIGKHMIFVIDGFGALYDDGEAGYGGRCELRFKF